MSRTEMYRRIGLTLGRRSCSEKEWYSSREDAARAVHAHRRRIAVCYGVSEYPCPEHQCWHWGHSDRHRVANRMIWESFVWFMAWQVQSKPIEQLPTSSSIKLPQAAASLVQALRDGRAA